MSDFDESPAGPRRLPRISLAFLLIVVVFLALGFTSAGYVVRFIAARSRVLADIERQYQFVKKVELDKLVQESLPETVAGTPWTGSEGFTEIGMGRTKRISRSAKVICRCTTDEATQTLESLREVLIAKLKAKGATVKTAEERQLRERLSGFKLTYEFEVVRGQVTVNASTQLPVVRPERRFFIQIEQMHDLADTGY